MRTVSAQTMYLATHFGCLVHLHLPYVPDFSPPMTVVDESNCILVHKVMLIFVCMITTSFSMAF